MDAAAERIPGTAFGYRDGILYAEGVPVPRIADAVGTPFYCYSATALVSVYRAFAASLTKLPATICYALKANSNLAVIALLAEQGAGADVVSEGELRRALKAGVPAGKIVFSGVGKTASEMAYALDAGIMQFNIESEGELELLNEVAVGRNARATVSIRVNPDVDALTHEKISTGRKQDKFGIDIARLETIYRRATDLPGIEPVGIAVHIGSQLVSLAPYRAAFERVAGAVRDLRAAGMAVRRVDLGGGIGIDYRGETTIRFDDYAALVEELFAGLDVELVFEPGRMIAGNAGILVARVLYRKRGGERPILVVDAAMNDLKRPAMYGAYHVILPVAEPAGETPEAADVVGPICESGDTFATARMLPPIRPGELVAFGSAGAYGAVMSSTYNTRPLVAEVLVSDDRFDVIRERQDLDRLLDLDHVPEWITENAGGAGADRRGAA